MEKMQGIKMQLQDKISSHRRKLERKSSLEKTRITTNTYHSYTFRFDKPYVKKIEKPPPLSINAIEPPAELIAFNTGSSLEKWCKKRPRLKSSMKIAKEENKDIAATEGEETNGEKNKDSGRNESQSEDSEEHDDMLSCERYFDDEKLYSHRFFVVKKFKNEYLPRNKSGKSMEVNNNSEVGSSYKYTHSKNRKKQKMKPRKNGKKKIVTLSLSKPVGPETIQVIRVAVTSSYSYEDIEDSSIDNDYCKRFKEILKSDDDVEEHVDDYMLTCQKVILVPRDT